MRDNPAVPCGEGVEAELVILDVDDAAPAAYVEVEAIAAWGSRSTTIFRGRGLTPGAVAEYLRALVAEVEADGEPCEDRFEIRVGGEVVATVP